MAAALYGPSHPYGYTELGTEASNKAMSAADLRTFWSKGFSPNNAALIVSGRITEAELRQLAEKAFGDWPRGSASGDTLPLPVTTKARVLIVDRPNAPQTQIRVASIGASRETSDYDVLRVMNETLGGLFTSRINLNLREEHGYTYGASSQFVFRRSAGPFLVASGVRTDVTAPAVSEVMKELARMRTEPMTPDELTLAKDSLIRSLPAEFETSGRVTASTTNLFLYDLGLDYYVKMQDRLAAVTAAQAATTARRYIDPGKALVIAVGDKAKIGPELEKLNLGAVETWSPDAVPAASAGAATRP
jgi:zinc protease